MLESGQLLARSKGKRHWSKVERRDARLHKQTEVPTEKDSNEEEEEEACNEWKASQETISAIFFCFLHSETAKCMKRLVEPDRWYVHVDVQSYVVWFAGLHQVLHSDRRLKSTEHPIRKFLDQPSVGSWSPQSSRYSCSGTSRRRAPETEIPKHLMNAVL